MSVWSILALPILEVVLVGALAGIVGVIAVLNRRVFFAESVAHGTFPGAVLGVVIASGLGANHGQLSLALFVGALLMCIPLAHLMRFLAGLPGISSQAAAGIVLTLGFALGYFLATWFQPLPLHVGAFLTGSVLTVTGVDVAAAAACLALVGVLAWTRGRSVMGYCFDPYTIPARMRARIDAMILGSIVLTVVVVIPAVGTVLSIALIAAPAAGLKGIAPSLRTYAIAAPIAGIAIGLGGLALAVWADLSAGGCVAVIAGVFFVACMSIERIVGTRA